MVRNQLSIVNNLEDLQIALLELARAGKKIAFVPTMGALHTGHAALIKQGRELADVVVVSIFVNPTQFGVNEDFARYPRTLDTDAEVARVAGANLIYAPSVEDMYPDDFATTISAGEMGKILCGKFRAGHFDGVATVVVKLLMRVMPHIAIFGEKDYQQLAIIRRVVEDLDLPTEIVGAEIVREADGLALSSRNRYLSEAERKIAPILYNTLAQTAVAIGSIGAETAIASAINALSKAGFKVDYMQEFQGHLLVAAWLGNTRLIDNVEM